MEGYPEYEVEEILSARKRGRGIQYLVKWKDYGNEEIPGNLTVTWTMLQI